MVGLFQGYRKSHTWIIATGLAQVSEFSIVLGSRARRLRIVTREVSNDNITHITNKALGRHVPAMFKSPLCECWYVSVLVFVYPQDY